MKHEWDSNVFFKATSLAWWQPMLGDVEYIIRSVYNECVIKLSRFFEGGDECQPAHQHLKAHEVAGSSNDHCNPQLTDSCAAAHGSSLHRLAFDSLLEDAGA